MKRLIPIFFGLICLILVGLRGIAIAGSATVRWQANTEPDLEEYRVYYGTSSRNYGPGIPVGKVTSYTINNLEEGKTYYFAVTAVDTAGNESGFSQEVSKTIADTHAPTLVITSPTGEPTYTTQEASLALAGTASDNVGIKTITWSNSRGGSGTAAGTGQWSVSGITLQDGQNIITVTAKDAAGNETSKTLTVTYNPPDLTNPVVNITSPSTSGTYETHESTITLKGTASDNVEVVEVTWANSRGGNGAASGTGTWSVTGITLYEGENVIAIKAKDAAGNEGSASITITYVVPDTTAPAPPKGVMVE